MLGNSPTLARINRERSEKNAKAEARLSLSEMASKVCREIRGEAAAHEEVDMMYAPSECHGDVSRGFDKRVLSLLEKGGWSPAEFMDELESRVSEKWVWSSGIIMSIGHLLPGCLICGRTLRCGTWLHSWQSPPFV